jgi:hypothetical protein
MPCRPIRSLTGGPRMEAAWNPTSPVLAYKLLRQELRGLGGPYRPRRHHRPRGFEHAACWGTNLPLTRDSPSIQGMSLAQTPPGLPLTRRSPRRGSLVGGSRRGLPCQAKVRHAERRCPTSDVYLIHVWGTRDRSMRSGAGHQRYVARRLACDVSRQGADVPVCLGRPGGWLAGGWLGQGFHQRPDLGIGVASVTTQGTKIGQSALLRPAAHRLWRHMKELGDLRCTEVPRLGWLWHRTLHSRRVSPIWGTTLSPSGATAIQRSTQRASRRLTTCDARSMRTASSPATDAPPSRSGCA